MNLVSVLNYDFMSLLKYTYAFLNSAVAERMESHCNDVFLRYKWLCDPEHAVAVLLGSMTGIMPFAAALVSAIVSSVISSVAGELQSGSFAHFL